MAVYCPSCGRQYDVTLFPFGRTVECDCGAVVGFGAETPPPPGPDEAVELPIDGTLDLHAFDPADVGDLVPEYLRACREKDILRVRVVHGKGTGELMRTVHAVLKRVPEVVSFELAGPWEGGSGATIVRLRPAGP